MKNRAPFLLAAVFAVFAPGASGASQEPGLPPTYTNVEVVSVDPATRLVVIKNAKGASETFDLDDGVAGATGVKAGDRVIMTVRGEPGRKRISAITKVTASITPREATPLTIAENAPVIVTERPPVAAVDEADLAEATMRIQFGNQVASLSQQARSVDAVWASFVNTCAAKASDVDGGRAWFGLWDGRAKADLSSGFCRDLFNQIVSSGEGIKKGMAAAEDVARKTLGPGEIRSTRRLYAMDWEGWELPAPDKLEL